MLWIKRNLYFVISGGVALVLLIVVIVFLLARIKNNAAVTEELDQQVNNLRTLYGSDPHPNDENIAAVRKEQEKLRGFMDEAKKVFSVAPKYPELDNQSFNALLANSIHELHTGAARAGVQLPPQYWFSFAAQRGALEFNPSSIPPLMLQIQDIKSIAKVLYDARVNALEAIRRVPVSTNDLLGTADYLTRSIATNDLATFTPYEVSFTVERDVSA